MQKENGLYNFKAVIMQMYKIILRYRHPDPYIKEQSLSLHYS